MKKKKKLIVICVISALVLLAIVLLFVKCWPEVTYTVTYTPDEPGAQYEPPDYGFTFTVLATHTYVYEAGDSRADYLVVSGLSDHDAEALLNEGLFMFSAWATGAYAYPYDEEETPQIITSTLEYEIVGDFLSVRQVVTRYTEGAAHPTIMLEAAIFDITTGEQAGAMSDFIVAGDELRYLITSGVFAQVYPAEIENALERLAAEIVDNADPDRYDTRFYLTEDTFGLFIETLYAEGGYWAFEAPYEAILPVLTDRLLAAVEE